MLGLLVQPPVAWALDFLAAAESTVLYDAPSAKSRPQRLIARGTPVEQVVVVGAWVKVRDAKGALGWMEKAQLSEQRMVMVRAAVAQVRSEAADTAALVFEADPDVVLELVAVGPPGWAAVRHRDGQRGFVKATQVWGL